MDSANTFQLLWPEPGRRLELVCMRRWPNLYATVEDAAALVPRPAALLPAGPDHPSTRGRPGKPSA